MSWVLLIIRLVSNLPALISLIKEIVEFIETIRDGKDREEEIKTLKKNIYRARFKDFQPIRDQLKRLQDRYEQL